VGLWGTPAVGGRYTGGDKGDHRREGLAMNDLYTLSVRLAFSAPGLVTAVTAEGVLSHGHVDDTRGGLRARCSR